MDLVVLIVVGCCAAVVSSVLLVRCLRERARRRAADRWEKEALGALLDHRQWREGRRRAHRFALAEWQREFDWLVGPVPCDGSDHNHIDEMRFGSREVRVICVPKPQPRGGISAAEAARVLERIATIRPMYLSPGERVMGPDEIARLLARDRIEGA
jgi:hypothetical protein